MSTRPSVVEKLELPMGGNVDDYRTQRCLCYKKQFRFTACGTAYIVDSYIAKGTFGQCYLARDEATTGQDIVIKAFTKPQREKHREHDPWTKEVANINAIPRLALTHPNIIKIISVCAEPLVRFSDCGFLLLEACTNGELLSYLQGAFTERMTRHFMRDLLRAIAHLHAHGVAHRDVKAENILIDSRGRLRLCDFGAAKYFGESAASASASSLVAASSASACPAKSSDDDAGANGGAPALPCPALPPCSPGAPVCGELLLMKTTTRNDVGTPGFVSPQMKDRYRYEYYLADKLDVFACGVVAFTLLHCDMPFGRKAARTMHALLDAGAVASGSESDSDSGSGGGGSSGAASSLAPTPAVLPPVAPTHPRFWSKWRTHLSEWSAGNPQYYPHAVLSAETESFLNRVFRLEAEAIPSAAELLSDPWLAGGDDASRYPTAALYTKTLLRKKAGTRLECDPCEFALDVVDADCGDVGGVTPISRSHSAASSSGSTAASSSASNGTEVLRTFSTASLEEYFIPVMAPQLSLQTSARDGIVDPIFRQDLLLSFGNSSSNSSSSARVAVAAGAGFGAGASASSVASTSSSPWRGGDRVAARRRISRRLGALGVDAARALLCDAVRASVAEGALAGILLRCEEDVVVDGDGDGDGDSDGATQSRTQCELICDGEKVGGVEFVSIHLTVRANYSKSSGHTLRVLRRVGSAVVVSELVRALYVRVKAHLSEL
jgi:serine/threonine protein kinase